ESHFVDEKISSRICRKEIKECNFPDNKFDIITMWHTLEHFKEPRDYLLEIKRILKRKGILVIALPNFDSLQAKLTKGNWFHLDVPRHLIHFTPRTLIACLESSGFSVLKISHFPLVYSIFGSIQSIINIFSGKKNMLFDLLNSKIKFRDIRNREIGLRDLLIMSLLIIPVSVIAIPFLFLEYLLKRGGVITLRAALRNPYKGD
ncbi:MAG: class I SAM-dependent methyltransferase, partial [bacterium]|nr:class I SAM-dependent methyltransferase [bacterium]